MSNQVIISVESSNGEKHASVGVTRSKKPDSVVTREAVRLTLGKDITATGMKKLEALAEFLKD